MLSKKKGGVKEKVSVSLIQGLWREILSNERHAKAKGHTYKPKKKQNTRVSGAKFSAKSVTQKGQRTYTQTKKKNEKCEGLWREILSDERHAKAKGD